jgi:hypothetical protein
LTVRGGFTVILCDTVFVDVALIVAIVALVAPWVETVKVAEFAPAEIVTEAGTVTTVALLLERETTTPPVGAALAAVTVPVDLFPLTG